MQNCDECRWNYVASKRRIRVRVPAAPSVMRGRSSIGRAGCFVTLVVAIFSSVLSRWERAPLPYAICDMAYGPPGMRRDECQRELHRDPEVSGCESRNELPH